MTRNTPTSKSRGTTAELSPKSARLIRSDHDWDTHKDDIRMLYMCQDMPLRATMEVIESKYAFKRSPRKWKSKMKEWEFVKHIPMEEMAFIALKSDERMNDSTKPKNTVFIRGNICITHDRITNFKKLKKTELSSSNVTFDAGKATPPNIRYYTPEPGSREETSTVEDDQLSEALERRPESTFNSDESVQSDDETVGIRSMRIGQFQNDITLSWSQYSPSPDTRIKAMVARADHLQTQGQIDEAEISYRRIIDEIKSDCCDIKWKVQCSLCKLLCKKQPLAADPLELARLLIANWAWVYKHSYSCENGSELYQLTLRLSCIDDAGSSSLQEIRILASELLVPFGGFGKTWRFGSRDPNSEILLRAIQLANGCSEVGWHEVTDTLFSVLMGGSLAAFDRVGRKFDKIRAHIWHAHHHQRRQRWEAAVSTLCDAYGIITSTLLLSGNSEEYHTLSSQLKCALNNISLFWRDTTSSIRMKELINLDELLNSIIANDRDSKLGVPRLNCESATHSSSNAGRYGVTYSESMMSGISFNYSALFP